MAEMQVSKHARIVTFRCKTVHEVVDQRGCAFHDQEGARGAHDGAQGGHARLVIEDELRVAIG